jgi:hypothetical protein
MLAAKILTAAILAVATAGAATHSLLQPGLLEFRRNSRATTRPVR